MTDGITIEGPILGAGPECERVLRDLPDWFGIEEAVKDYVINANNMPSFVARQGSKTVGIMALKIHFKDSAELYVLGVVQALHRKGIGHLLLKASEAYLSEQGISFVQVKTLSANNSDKNYAKTRKFYEAEGYTALEEFPELWDPHNPCLQMIKYITN